MVKGRKEGDQTNTVRFRAGVPHHCAHGKTRKRGYPAARDRVYLSYHTALGEFRKLESPQTCLSLPVPWRVMDPAGVS